MYNSPVSIQHGPLELEYIDKYLESMSSAEDEHIVARARSLLGVDIDRDELIKALNYDRQQYEKGYEDGKRDAVKQGRWERDDWGDYVKECSLCGKVPNAIPGRGNTPCYSDYCPNCGAKMDGKT